mmetsp:Transcript_10517/g.17627  ORF Transcript_10517/g.17627 Transcript_10517/m.17627 type:complete len:443 (+) Transcript_10517:941-2269(+)
MRRHLAVLGLGQAAYWAGNFLFDALAFALQASLMVLLVFPLGLRGFQHEAGAMARLLALFGPAHILFSYLASFSFNRPQTALKFVSMVYLVAGFVIPFVLKVLSVGTDRCQGYFYAFSQVVTQMVPLQPLSTGLISLVNSGHTGLLEEQKEKQEESTRRQQEIAARHGRKNFHADFFSSYQSCDGFVKDVDSALVALFLSALISLLAVLLVEKAKLYFYQSAESKYEKLEALPQEDADKLLVASRLSKTYAAGKKQAVKAVSFSLARHGEILGLLGANGAGKSSTFNMATMQLKRTSGDIFLFGLNISEVDSLRGVNITNQADVLWPLLSVEEHFRVMALVSGRPDYRARFEQLSARLELGPGEKCAQVLSGGTRRKLCTALTLLTTPELAFFDEPTVGLDPVARRSLLSLIKQSGASVLFTTHRLDEAEFLCSRVAILKQG